MNDISERNYLAAMAMQVLLQRVGVVSGYSERAAVKDAYTVADLMLVESKK
jgi:hypothetical protein